ncbi:MAG: MBOAT family O-acyltransferase [Leptospiraceae bacterium]|nr:MBOAT family O-acyltransferase [Leptospiraceae bacterium]
MLILLAVVTIDYFCSFIIANNGHNNARFFLVISLFSGFGILLYFKYLKLILLTFNQMNYLFLVKNLPIGISFFVFQSSSYVIDVFKRKIEPVRSYLDYLLYICFFPQLVAGPIMRAEKFFPQLENLFLPSLLEKKFAKVLFFLLSGYLKKSVLSDSVAPIADHIYSYYNVYSWDSILIGLIAYSIQIYFDFSGYTDIARGSALIFGIELPENFSSPYISIGFSEFWTRWHISLSLWLKEYLYFSIGGNRYGVSRTFVNLLLTMFLGGLWHGASWNFAFWGFLHGVYLSIERLFKLIPMSITPLKLKNSRFWKVFLFSIRLIIVYSVVTLTWVFFRANSFEDSLNILTKLIRFDSGSSLGYSDRNLIQIVFLLMMIFSFISDRFTHEIEEFLNQNVTQLKLFLASFLLIIMILLSRESKPFIYFVF